MIPIKWFSTTVFILSLTVFPPLTQGQTPGMELDQLETDKQAVDKAKELAPFVPTPMEVVVKMLDLAKVTNKDMVYDLGSGDGRIVIRAAGRIRHIVRGVLENVGQPVPVRYFHAPEIMERLPHENARAGHEGRGLTCSTHRFVVRARVARITAKAQGLDFATRRQDVHAGPSLGEAGQEVLAGGAVCRSAQPVVRPALVG